MQRRFALLTTVLLALAILAPASAFAWGSGNVDSLDDRYWGTHDWIVWQAYVEAGRPAWFKVNEALLNNDNPDDTDADKLDHVFHVDNQYGGAPWRVGELYTQAVKAHDRGDYVAASQAIGLLSHYYSDITVPFHTKIRESGTIYDELHDPYERAARDYSHLKSDRRMLTTRSRKTATNVRTMTRYAAAAANTKLSTVVSGRASFSDPAVRDATRYVLSRAVNDLADMMKSVPSGAGTPPAASGIASFKPYRRYTGKYKYARADARIVDKNGNPLRAMKVIFTWQMASGTQKLARYTDADGWVYCWKPTGSQPYFSKFTATPKLVSAGTTYTDASEWYATTPVLKDGSAGWVHALSNNRPKQYTTVKSKARAISTSGKPVAGLKVKFAWEFKSKTVYTYATTDSYGYARTSKYIGGATKGYRVYVRAYTQAGGNNRRWTSSFIPQ